MADREKVIEHIADCVRIADCQINHNWVFVRTEILKDALALLKAQEPKPPTIKENAYGWKFYYCASCGKEFYQNNKFNFCEKCGQAVKWEWMI